jgi:hypothetical protein
MIDATSVTRSSRTGRRPCRRSRRRCRPRCRRWWPVEIVLRDAGLDLADEVRADVGRLGEDATDDPQEERQKRAAEPEPDEDGRGRVLEEHDDDGGAEQAEAGGEQAGHAAGAEGNLQSSRVVAAPRGCGGPDVASHGQPHAEEADRTGEHAADQEGDGAEAARLRLIATPVIWLSISC